MLRVISANLNGIRSASTKGFFDWMARQSADFVCVQELKAQEPDMAPGMLAPTGYQGYFHYAEKKGYSGVGIYARHEPLKVVVGLGVPEIDAEGRYIELVYERLSVVSVYLPSGSSGEHRQAAKFEFMEHFFGHLATLVACGREVVICGDWNIAHKEADLKNWKGNLKNSGFLPEERAWLTRVFDELGWVDTYRRLEPDATETAYTWWSNRGQAWAKNVGWRIDYQIATNGLANSVSRASIFKDVRFSDHAPLILDYGFELSGPAGGLLEAKGETVCEVKLEAVSPISFTATKAGEHLRIRHKAAKLNEYRDKIGPPADSLLVFKGETKIGMVPMKVAQALPPDARPKYCRVVSIDPQRAIIMVRLEI